MIEVEPWGDSKCLPLKRQVKGLSPGVTLSEKLKLLTMTSPKSCKSESFVH